MQTELLGGIRPVAALQLIVPAKFEWVVEAQGIVKHQPQPNQHHRTDRRR